MLDLSSNSKEADARSEDSSPPASPILALSNLHVRFETADGEVHAVKGATLDLAAGETLAIVGESGSGKSQLMLAAIGLLASNGRASGSARYRGRELLGLSKRELNEVRGRKITMIFQEPMTSLDPLYTIGNQICEVIRRHTGKSAAEARARALDLLHQVQIPDAESRLGAYPHELSGGQRQRVMIAMAIANDPDVLIADEPTTALDVTIQAEILHLLKDLQTRLGMGLVIITHDLGIVRRIAQRVLVMRQGEVVECGAAAAIFERPRHDYTRALLAAEPTGRKAPPPADASEVLSGEAITVRFNLGGRWFGGGGRVLTAVDGVSINLKAGQTIGIVGEIRLWQVDTGAGAVAAAAIDRHHPLRRHRHLAASIASACGRCARDCRSFCRTRSAHCRHALRSARSSPRASGCTSRASARRERDRRAGEALAEVQLDPACATATRTSSPAASGSASPSPAPSS